MAPILNRNIRPILEINIHRMAPFLNRNIRPISETNIHYVIYICCTLDRWDSDVFIFDRNVM